MQGVGGALQGDSSGAEKGWKGENQEGLTDWSWLEGCKGQLVCARPQF
jgi:hypothetical protein